MDSNKGSKVKLDKEKLDRLKAFVYSLEQRNHSDRKLRDNEMVDKIIKKIMQEVENDN